MQKHKMYFTDKWGGYNGYDRQTVFIEEHSGVLHVGKRLTIPLVEIMAAEVRPLPGRPKTNFLAIDVCGPTVEGGKQTTIALIHKNFLGNTKDAPMQALVDELRAFITGNSPVPVALVSESEPPPGLLKAQYALNISLLIGFYRKLWYSYDSKSAVATKSLLLMLLAGIVNLAGVLLVAVPFDNYRMSRNLVSAGWSRRSAIAAYVLLSCPAYVWWVVTICRWSARGN